MRMDQKEKLIRERREIEAVKKNLLGSGGKFGVILRNMGQPIMSQGGGYLDYSPAPDPWLLEVEDKGEIDLTQVHDPDDSADAIPIGWIFDGLSFGMHLEIRYLSEDARLTVHYKGYLVFSEEAGHLVSYAPFPEWEEMVDRLFGTARKKDETRRRAQAREDRQEAEKEARGILQRLRLRWNI